MNDKTVASTLKNTPPKWLKTDFQIAVYPALAAFVSYHNSLEPPLQQKLVKCLQSGMFIYLEINISTKMSTKRMIQLYISIHDVSWK